MKGVSFDFGGETLMLPPLSLRSVSELRERIATLTDGTSMDSISTVIDVAVAALRRNYPDMTAERVGDLVDVGNMQAVMMAVMSPNSIKPATAPSGVPAVSREATLAPEAGAAPAAPVVSIGPEDA